MTARRWLQVFCLWSALTSGVYAASEPDEQLNDRSPVTALEHLWNTARTFIYPESLATRFTERRLQALRSQAETLSDLSDVAPLLNQFLDTLGVSHTQVYARGEVEHALFRALFSTRELNQPLIAHLGMQYANRAGRWYVREIWNGLPADRAGLRRGDALLMLGDRPFEPSQVCAGGKSPDGARQRLKIRRAATVRTVELTCVRQNPNASLLVALQNSIQVFEIPDADRTLRIGYIHLWAGTHPDMLSAYVAAIARLGDTDGLILDLRGGFGGAWYEYLDPFFADRTDFYSYTVSNRQGSETVQPEPHTTVSPYTAPMVVLINEGVRSGKEALAFQFKKSGRAPLIGTTTRGAFSAGRGIFTAEQNPLLLYLSVAELRLDGQRIEGVGVAPDVTVDYPIAAARPEEADPQFAAALALLAKRIRQQ